MSIPNDELEKILNHLNDKKKIIEIKLEKENS